jgi:hypothetical protein
MIVIHSSRTEREDGRIDVVVTTGVPVYVVIGLETYLIGEVESGTDGLAVLFEQAAAEMRRQALRPGP